MLREELLGLLDRLRRVGRDLREVEVKRAQRGLPERIWETISAFANAPGGGAILFGVDESTAFEVVGVSDPAKLQADLASVCDRMEPPVRPIVDIHEVEGKPVVVAEIPETPLEQKPCYYRPAGLTHGSYIRVADGDRRLTEYEIQLFLAWRQRARHDRMLVVGKTLADLNPERVRAFVEHLRAHKPQAIYHNWDEARLLTTFGIVSAHRGHLIPTLAGYLCFADFPQDEFPGLHLTVVRYPGVQPGQPGERGERLLDNVKVEGCLPEMVLQGLRAIQRNLQMRTIVRGLFREDVPEYPLEFLREALVNALAHRDYSPPAQSAPVQVRIFPDRIEIENPGGLFGPVTEERLGEPGLTAARNETLMRILEDLPAEPGRVLCENRGTGIVAILESLHRAGLQPPRFEDKRTTFKVTVSNTALLDTEALKWLNQFQGALLSDEQRVILAYTRKMGQVTHADVRRLHPGLDGRVITTLLGNLVNKGFLEQHGTRRWTVYTLTEHIAQVESPRTQRTATPNSIVELLRRAGALSAQEIADQLNIKPATVRHHLRRLRREGRIQTTTPAPKSPNVRYRLADD